MRIITDIREMNALSSQMRQEGGSIGLVPTMGALHEGHLSLIKRARQDNEHVIISIFVNPIQFDRESDLLSYPRDLDKDRELASRAGVDIVFEPQVQEVYPEGFSNYVDPGRLAILLCGTSRPGHFRGVATIVAKLFNIIKPHKAYFGQKDFQQSIIVKKLVDDLNMDVAIIVLPTVRHPDGLACSSRNRHLNDYERADAACLYEAIKRAGLLFESGIRDSDRIVREMVDIINSRKGVKKIDYVSIVHPDTLEELSIINGRALVAIAIWVGATRLIDNCLLG